MCTEAIQFPPPTLPGLCNSSAGQVHQLKQLEHINTVQNKLESDALYKMKLIFSNQTFRHRRNETDEYVLGMRNPHVVASVVILFSVFKIKVVVIF